MFAVHTVIVFPLVCASCSHHVTERDVLSRETICQSVQMTPGGGFFEAHRPKSRFVTMWTVDGLRCNRESLIRAQSHLSGQGQTAYLTCNYVRLLHDTKI